MLHMPFFTCTVQPLAVRPPFPPRWHWPQPRSDDQGGFSFIDNDFVSSTLCAMPTFPRHFPLNNPDLAGLKQESLCICLCSPRASAGAGTHTLACQLSAYPDNGLDIIASRRHDGQSVCGCLQTVLILEVVNCGSCMIYSVGLTSH